MSDKENKIPVGDKDTVTADPIALDEGSCVTIDPVAEKKMMRKFDLVAIGLLGLFYMMANLDRSNVGNANVAGLSDDLGLVGNQFGTAVTLLYATYVPFETPAAVLMKIIGPKKLLSFSAFAWGVTTLGMGFIHSWKGLYACRLLIGAFEAGLMPCINVYIALTYKKSERARRSSVIFAFSAIASAFGGVLAFGLTQIHGPSGFSGWRWLFIVEGALTIILVPLFFFLFPDHPANAWFLTPEEKAMVKLRYETDPHWGVDDEFSWSQVGKAFVDPKFYAFVVFQFSVDISLYGFTTFLPSIIEGMGYTSVRANLLTVPVYTWGLLWFLGVGYMSDRTGNRGYWIGGPLLALIIGYAILIGVETVGVRYFACFITVMGIYPTTGMSLMWLSDNVARHFKRATMVGMTLTLGNTAGVAVGQIFTSASGPRYIKGLSISMALAALALCSVASLMIGMTVANRKRAERIRLAEEEGNPLPYQPEKGDMDPHFVYRK